MGAIFKGPYIIPILIFHPRLQGSFAPLFQKLKKKNVKIKQRISEKAEARLGLGCCH